MAEVSPTAGTGLAAALTGTPQSGNSFMDALRGFQKFLTAKPGSASNNDKYKKALIDAGLPEGDTGVGE